MHYTIQDQVLMQQPQAEPQTPARNKGVQDGVRRIHGESGEPVNGETRVPKLRQCSGTRGMSFFRKLMGNVLHADQYARAPCDSMRRIEEMSSA
ncbi:MAG TPA: hypothetical protein VNO32_04370, partial [Candidatus Acidoferrum sp.]|nr:hypothetical protein [Candidatus Acidoferrum sp.]